MILKEWEWKNKIFFDKDILNEVYSFFSYLNEEELIIFKKQVEFYLSFYTINNLIVSINSNITKAHDYIKIAKENIHKCTYTHPSLKAHLEELISVFKNDIKNELLSILEYSLSSDYKVSFFDYLKFTFANKYNEILKIINIEASKKLIEYEPLVINDLDVRKYYDNNLNKLIDNENIILRYGPFINDNYDILIANGKGYGEWWDKDLYNDYSVDTLVLFKNRRITIDDYFYTIAHEVYPGHRHFFKMVKKENTSIDTAAFLLIEGYATYTEINTISSIYSYNLRIKYAKSIIDILNGNLDELSFYTLFNSNQNIGFIESYYFGAFAIEYLIENKFKTAKDFLQFLKNKNKGDFFALW